MTITRPHVCELEVAKAEPDDHGNVLIIVASTLTPDEARELITEISTAADAAAAYLAEQNGARP